MVNPQAVKEATEAIMSAVDEHTNQLETEEYIEVLNDVISDLQSRRDAAEDDIAIEEMEDEIEESEEDD